MTEVCFVEELAEEVEGAGAVVALLPGAAPLLAVGTRSSLLYVR